ncbi:MAG: GntR family transcriptional regulator [Sphingomonadales bacterium]|nr:GntR family transcriptional regulator [Sphingomonadales bacterium]
MADKRPIFASDVPIHHQIYELVRADIADGLYAGSTGFPGETELAKQLGVSVATSRAVLQRLAVNGLLDRGRGRRPQAIFDQDDHKVTPLTANIDLFTFQLLDIAETIAPWEACRTFGVQAGSSLWRCVRLRLFDGVPHSVTFSYQPLETGRQHGRAATEMQPIPRLLAAVGLPVSRTEGVVGVRRPPADVSIALNVDLWDKLLFATLISFSGRNRPVDFTRIFYHPDQMHSLSAVHGEGFVAANDVGLIGNTSQDRETP